MGNKNLLIFGGGDNQLSLIKTAIEMGINTIVIDPNANAPAKKIAHCFEQVAARDFEKTVDVATHYSVHGIITSQMENPLMLMAELAAKMGFIFPSPDQIKKARNKYLMKQCFLASGVPCAKGKLFLLNDIISESELLDFTYPLIIKPVDSFSSRGVFKVNSFLELQGRVEQSRQFASDGSVLVEEFLDGPEVSVESITYQGATTVMQITDKVITDYPHTVELAHIQPSELPNEVQQQIKQTVQAAVASLGIQNSASHAELKITKSGVKMVEIGARLGGDYISSLLVNLSCGTSLEAAAISVALGMEPVTTPVKQAGSAIRYLQLPEGREVSHVGNYQEIFDWPFVHHALVLMEKGQVVPPVTDSAKRPGFVIVSGNTRKQALENSLLAEEKLKSFISLK